MVTSFSINVCVRYPYDMLVVEPYQHVSTY